MTMVTADQETDARYNDLRRHYAGDDPRANGYVSSSFFRREQRLVWSLLAEHAHLDGPVLDIACGSGLMLADWPSHLSSDVLVFGVDFNFDASVAARRNGFTALRGDAFCLPLADRSVAAAVNCQFFNQQSVAAVPAFMVETRRVLKSGGVLVLVWRGQSLLHQLVHALHWVGDASRQFKKFPQVMHRMMDVERAAQNAGLDVVFRGISLPMGSVTSVDCGNPVGHLLGASNFLVLKNNSAVQ